MAKFRMVHTEFWGDVKVVEEMTAEDKYFFLYLLTNSYTTQVGIYQITKKQMAFDLGYSPEATKALLDRFINHHKMIAYNDDTREIAIKNWGKYNLSRGGKPMIDCVKSELKQVKDKTLIPYVGERVERNDIKVLYDTYNDTCLKTGQEKEEEEEQEEEKEQEEEEIGSSQNVYEFYQQNFGVLSPYIGEEIGYWVQDLNEELVRHALEIALDNQKPFSYAKAIMKTWTNRNVKTVDEAKALSAEFKQKQESKFGRKGKEEVVPDWFIQQKQKKKSVEIQTRDSPGDDQQDMDELMKRLRS